MKTKQFLRWSWSVVLLSLTVLCANVTMAYCQAPSKNITVYQYRYVAPEKVEEFIKRETTYWSEVAKKATEKGNLTFWALLQKVGGSEGPDNPNFLFINTYKDIDAAGAVWSLASTVFPKVPMAQMSTDAISKTTTTYFLSDQAWEQSSKVSEKDFKYVQMIYHAAPSPGELIALEKKHWAPFIKKIMEDGLVSQIAWGNAALLAPFGGDVKFTTVSYDLYPNLKEVLNPTWDSKIVLPEGLQEIIKLEGNSGRWAEVYGIVKSVSAATGM